MQKETYMGRTWIRSAEHLEEVCAAPVPEKKLPGKEWKPELPRIRGEAVHPAGRGEAHGRWVAECWWRSEETGFLGYYAKKSLWNGQLLEFRELAPGETAAVRRDPAGEARYLRMAAQAVMAGPPEPEASRQLEDLWLTLAPEDLKAWEPEPRKKQEPVPRALLESWNWEKLKKLLLARYDTTEEEIRDYEEYRASGTEERYVPLRYREECRAKGMRFWRDGHDR